MKEFSTQKIKNVLKDLLKKKGITYEEAASQLNCSVPTINRILGPEEISLTRLLELCELVGISFSELGQLANDNSSKEQKFTPEQEAFLAKNPHFFAYLMKLLSGDSPKKIAEDQGLEARSNEKYLIGLENQGLIRVTGKNRVQPLFKDIPSLGSGPLGKMYFEKIISTAARFYIDNIRSQMHTKQESESIQFSLMCTLMTKSTYAKYVEEIQQISNHYKRLSDMEEKIKKPSELKIAVLVQGHTLVAKDNESLKYLENTFGEIKKI